MSYNTNKPAKATWELYEWLATDMYKNGLKADRVVPWLKSQKYLVNGMHYEATRVSAMVRGMELASVSQPKPVVESLVDAVALVNSNISDGVLKYTKAKLVHKPKEQS